MVAGHGTFFVSARICHFTTNPVASFRRRAPPLRPSIRFTHTLSPARLHGLTSSRLIRRHLLPHTTTYRFTPLFRLLHLHWPFLPRLRPLLQRPLPLPPRASARPDRSFRRQPFRSTTSSAKCSRLARES